MKFVTDRSKGILGNPDSETMWTEIISQIPDEMLLRPGLKILNPACGHCTEAVILAKRMISLGVDPSEVQKSSTLVDKYQVFTNPARMIYGFENVIQSDFLDWRPMEKFDISLCNPPYQDSGNSNKKLWVSFVERMIDMTNEDGYIAVVTPRSWIIRPDSQLSSKIISKILKCQLISVDLAAERYFPTIGENPCSYVIKKSPKSTKTRFIFAGRDEMINYTGQQIPITKEDELKISIFKKIRNAVESKISSRFYRDLAHLNIEKMIASGMIRTEPFENSIPIFWTASQTDVYHMPRDGIRKGIKIICNISGYYYSTKYPMKYLFIDSTDSFAISEGGIYCTDMEEAESLMSQLKSNLYRFYVDNEKTSGFNTGIGHLPILSTDRIWTDSEIYSHFELTNEEISYIESTVK